MGSTLQVLGIVVESVGILVSLVIGASVLLDGGLPKIQIGEFRYGG